MSTHLFSCIICLSENYGAKCSDCNNRMCRECNYALNEKMSINLPFYLAIEYSFWSCSWKCAYNVIIKHENYVNIPNSLNYRTSVLVKNKQQNILQSIKFPSTLNKYLPQDLTKIVIEYAEFLLQEN